MLLFISCIILFVIKHIQDNTIPTEESISEIGMLRTDAASVLAGEETAVTIELRMDADNGDKEEADSDNVVFLYKNGKKCGEMTLNKDSQTMHIPYTDSNGNMGIITGKVKDYTFTDIISGTAPGECYEYFASIGNKRSNLVQIYTVEKPSAEDYLDMEAIFDEISETEAPYVNTEGYMESEEYKQQALEDVGEYLKRLKSDGRILRYAKNNENIAIQHKCGIIMVYEPQTVEEATYYSEMNALSQTENDKNTEK